MLNSLSDVRSDGNILPQFVRDVLYLNDSPERFFYILTSFSLRPTGEKSDNKIVLASKYFNGI